MSAAAFDLPMPVVKIGPVVLPGFECPTCGHSDDGAEVPDRLAVFCSECSEGPTDTLVEGDRTAWGRMLLQNAAKAHATEAHDGLVVAEGWAR